MTTIQTLLLVDSSTGQVDNLAGPRLHRQQLHQGGQGPGQLWRLPVSGAGAAPGRGRPQRSLPQEEAAAGERVRGAQVRGFKGVINILWSTILSLLKAPIRALPLKILRIYEDTIINGHLNTVSSPGRLAAKPSLMGSWLVKILKILKFC